MRLLVEYVYNDDKVVHKLFVGKDAISLLERAKNNEHYKKSVCINYNFQETVDGDQ